MSTSDAYSKMNADGILFRERLVAEAIERMKNVKTFLLVQGPPNTGKTVLLGQIKMELERQKYHVLLLSAKNESDRENLLAHKERNQGSLFALKSEGASDSPAVKPSQCAVLIDDAQVLDDEADSKTVSTMMQNLRKSSAGLVCLATRNVSAFKVLIHEAVALRIDVPDDSLRKYAMLSLRMSVQETRGWVHMAMQEDSESGCISLDKIAKSLYAITGGHVGALKVLLNDIRPELVQSTETPFFKALYDLLKEGIFQKKKCKLQPGGLWQRNEDSKKLAEMLRRYQNDLGLPADEDLQNEALKEAFKYTLRGGPKDDLDAKDCKHLEEFLKKGYIVETPEGVKTHAFPSFLHDFYVHVMLFEDDGKWETWHYLKQWQKDYVSGSTTQET